VIGHLSSRPPTSARFGGRLAVGSGVGPLPHDEERATPRIKDDSLNGALLEPAAVLEGLPDAVVAATRDGKIVFVNALAEELFGRSRGELLGQPVQMLWPARLRDRYTRNMELYFATDHPMRFSNEAWGLRRDGSEFVGEMAWGIVQTSGGPVLLAVGRDISERLAAEARLRAVAALGEHALAGADRASLIREAVELLRTRLPVAHAHVRPPDVPTSPASPQATATATIRLPIGAGHELLLTPERELTDEELDLLRAIANTLAAALSHVRDEERMRYEAVHDPLTGLPNRTLLRDRLDHALARSAREGGATGVLFVDLDNFKEVNDMHSHAAGDAVLMKLGRRMRKALRPGDTVARFGGDEFVVVCEDIDEQSAVALGRRLRRAIEVPLRVGDLQHRLTASIGIAIGRADPELLIDRADAAVYRAKARGPGHVEVFS
jgi:diguanylate cyclase (GGDEF)-like protein/PAS domain S-box-containing protein